MVFFTGCNDSALQNESSCNILSSVKLLNQRRMKTFMPNLDLKDERLNEIANKAQSLWRDYSELNNLEPRDIFLTQRKSQDRKEHAVEFFKFCGNILTPALEGIVVEPSIVSANLMEDNPDSVRSISWLVWFKDSHGAECPVILLDFGYLNSKLSFADATRTRLELVLHETGHLFLHQHALRTKTSKYAKPAYPAMEAEAWWFCHAILGYCFAGCAYECRSQNMGDEGNYDDEAWRYCFPWVFS